MSYKKINADLEKFLYINAKQGNWEAVVAKYEASEVAQKLKLTREGDTALHLAVINNQEEIVEKLVNLISTSIDYKNHLEATNERDNNPLHLAAELGSARMCHAIASAHEGLVDKRNTDGETPLFLAAAHGHKDVFYCLYYFYRSDLTKANINCRRSDGDTVLHCALRNEHFDLAFQIISLNKEATNWVDGEGSTPLHVLAKQPTAFKSGAHTKGWQNIVYYCTRVDQLKRQSIETLGQTWKKSKSIPRANTTPNYSFPDHYHTCIEFFWILWEGFLKVTDLKTLLYNNKNDEAKKDNDSENLDTSVEPHQRPDTELHKADPSARELSNTNFPKNYTTCIEIFRFVFLAIMIILGFGFLEIRKIQKKKTKHTRSVQVMRKLLEFTTLETLSNDGKTPTSDLRIQTDDGTTLPYYIIKDEVQFSQNVPRTRDDSKKTINDQEMDSAMSSKNNEIESVMLLAAKYGVIEMVMGVFERFSPAIRETTKDGKNIVLLAAEYRQPDVYSFLLEMKSQIESLFRAVDENGNSALHLAAVTVDPKLWRITGAALQMQWEYKWYKFVKESVTLQYFARYNKAGKTARKIFHESHSDLIENGENWLKKTSKACSVVAALIATLAFATATSFPGGIDSKGAPLLEKHRGLFIFAVSSLIALCLSSTSVLMFLAILTSRFEAKDFGSHLPWKLLIGLSSLYFSIIAMLISFCAGHYFLIILRLKNVAILLYTLCVLPVALIFGLLQLPLYFDLLQAILKKVPQRSADVVILSNNPPPTHNLSKPFKTGKFEVASISVEKHIPSKPLLIFTPTAQGSYPVIFFLPALCSNESSYSAFLRLIASHGFVIVAPKPQDAMTTSSESETKETESATPVMRWQDVEAALSKNPVVGADEAFFLTLGYGGRSSHPLSAMICFHDDMAKTKFPTPQSVNIYAPTLESQIVISKLCGNVKLNFSRVFSKYL